MHYDDDDNDDEQDTEPLQDIGPTFTISTTDDTLTTTKQVVVVVAFEECHSTRSSRDLDLDLGSGSLAIGSVTGAFEKMQIELPFRVDAEKCRAKYSKKKSTLSVTMTSL